MKNIISFLTVISLFLIPFSSKAQWTGGGEQERVRTESELLTNKNFVKVGLALPSGLFGNKPAANSKAGGAKTGFSLQYGALRYFDLGFSTSNFGVGVNLPVSFSFNNWEHPDISSSSITYRPYFFVGVGVGPLVSYSPADDIVIDAFFNINPTFSLAGGYKGEVTLPVIGSIGEVDSYSQPVFGLGTNYGINVRYANLVFGFDVMPLELTYNMVTEMDGVESDNSPEEIDISASRINLSVGILF